MTACQIEDPKKVSLSVYFSVWNILLPFIKEKWSFRDVVILSIVFSCLNVAKEKSWTKQF